MRVPLSGALEVTHKCNLRCAHCYVGPARYSVQQDEMGKEQIFRLLDEICDAGCLHLLITGGEPLMRPDFCEIYEHAKRKGMILTVFTNGTLITRKILDLFSDLPPKVAEISLYGATPETYEAVTGIQGSYRSCIRGIENLLGRGINVALKTMLMSVNSHEFYEIERIAKSYGVKFRFDAALFPRFDQDRFPISLRVPVEEAIDKEFSDVNRLTEWKTFIGRNRTANTGDRLYSCGAGVSSFHIDAEGFLMPCLMVRHFKYDLRSGRFDEGWQTMAHLGDIKAANGHRCLDCSTNAFCDYCPAFFLLEEGDENLPSDYLCRLGKARSSVVMNLQ